MASSKTSAAERTPDLFTGKTAEDLAREMEAEERGRVREKTAKFEEAVSAKAGGISVRRGEHGEVWVIVERTHSRHEFMLLRSEAIALKRIMEGMKE